MSAIKQQTKTNKCRRCTWCY